MEVLVTGGFGNIGLWLVDSLIEHGHNVTVLARSKPEYAASLRISDLLLADVSNLEQCKMALEGREYASVIHLASINESELANYAALALEVNALGTRNILDSICHKSLRHFIYFSTFHVYGSCAGEITEESHLAPSGDYALSHLFAEHYIRLFHLNKSTPYTILRLTNGYGCPKNVESSKWYLILNNLAKMAFEEQRLVLKGSSNSRRDFISLKTVTAVVNKLINLKQAPNDTFNLSSGNSISLIEVAKEVQRAYLEYCGKEISLNVASIDLEKTSEELQLHVSSEKLKEFIFYDSAARFCDEAKAIFSLLEQNS